MDGTPKELTITSVEGPNEKGWMVIKTADGGKYGSKNTKLINYQGVTAVFNTGAMISNKNGKTFTNHYINDPLPEISAPRASSNPMLASKESNTALMVAKDILNARIYNGGQKDFTNSALVTDLMGIYSGIMSAMSAKNEEDQVPF